MKGTIKRLSCLLSGLVATFFLSASFISFSSSKPNSQRDLAPRQLLSKVDETPYSEETFLTSTQAPEDFSIEIKGATSTPRSKRIKAAFSSSATKTGYRDSLGLFYMVINDSRYSGKDSSPVKNPDDFPDGDIVFNGFTIAINAEEDPSADSIYLPEFLRRGSKYRIRNIMIESNAGTSYESVRSIYIPDSVKVVGPAAFTNVPEDLTFYVEHESKPEGWDDEWCDGGKVVWGYKDYPADKRSVARNTATKTFGVAPDYFLGRIDNVNKQYHKPLVVSYKVTTQSGEIITRWEELPLVSDINDFDGIGDNLGGSSMERNIELDFEDGETLDYDSITFYNIYPLASEETKLPDINSPYFCVAKKLFTEEFHISNYISYKFKATATFMNYTAVTMLVDRVDPSPYIVEMESVITEKAEFINSGRYVLRYAFYNLNACTYEVRYMENGVLVEKKIPVKTPETACAFKRKTDNQITFLINNADVGKNFTANKLVEFDISGLTLNMHLYDLDNNVKVGGRTELIKTFGRIEVKPNNAPLKLFSIDVFFAVFFPVYFLVYGLVSLGLYFFLKEKYKNNEFKRMKTKPFVTKCIFSAVCSAIVILELLSILFRTTIINNSVTVFNPIDIFIVFAGILSVIIIGYFIRYIYISVKNNLHRRQVARLNLDNDQADDGTK